MLPDQARTVSPRKTELMLVSSCSSSMPLMRTLTTRAIQLTTTMKAYMLNIVVKYGFLPRNTLYPMYPSSNTAGMDYQRAIDSPSS